MGHSAGEIIVEVDWDSMPDGSWCGSNIVVGNQQSTLVKCQGHDPKTSCPRGFDKGTIPYFKAGGGARWFFFCIKD